MKRRSFHQSLSSQAVGMANAQCAVLLLTLAIAVQECNGIPERTRCTSQPPCFDLLIVERMAQRVSKDVPGADSDNILLKSKTYDKIRQKKYLHSCVLEKIFEFYENVLSSDQYIQNDGRELIYTLDRVRNCTYKVKRCEMLYQKANHQADLEIAESDMSAQEVAIIQLQKLNHASERLNDTTILETAMDELKSLHHYIPGSAFLKSNG
ncbi:uncharacterized protein si:ch211-266a5.12 isoform X1 [Ictalurus punctatus]|uniref:Uncharacterized protein si:ch211-266a5.12 isoform X1 n=1 Tax=Ictalurus punctatus TaxID=7998 RepID=A0A2D0T3M0_ICTPU|nr:uncharacterized protein si:ch211-266a5.12 isoform X1 [Ictalurus punctatus]